MNIKKHCKIPIVIYTAISNSYDTLNSAPKKIDYLDFICFTDCTERKRYKGWRLVPFPETRIDQIRKCRNIKIRPHISFHDYKYSLWIDGNIKITENIIELIIFQLTKNSKITMFKHPIRDCIYEEAETCKILNKDNLDTINRQMQLFYRNGYPSKNGLVESGVLFREHNDKNVINIMEKWWDIVKTQSLRDQLSFNYVVWKNKFEYNYFAGSIRDPNKYLSIKPHRNNLLTYLLEWINLNHKKNAYAYKTKLIMKKVKSWVVKSNAKIIKS
jgi:hypothetical protein